MKPLRVFAVMAASSVSVVTLFTVLAPFGASFDLFRQLWPIWIIVGVLTAGLSAALRAWRSTGASFLSACALLTLPIDFYRDDGLVETQPVLTLASHNMWGRNSTPERAIEVLLELDADVVALQEAFSHHEPWTGQLSSQYPYQANCPNQSTKLFSRLPIIESGCTDRLLLDNPIIGRPIPGWDLPPAAWARLELPDGSEGVVMSVHMTWPNPLAPQAEERVLLSAALRQFDRDRLILLGDFNAAPPSVALRQMEEDWGVRRRTQGLPSWPAIFPFVAIDHLFAGDDWETVSIGRGGSTGSDHRPIIVELALAAEVP
jgi:endonuclease/exonuclease/phosphatase (EEP) superfamily protein YafD